MIGVKGPTGYEGSGEIIEVGSSEFDWLIGYWVAFLSKGAWGKYVNVNVSSMLVFSQEIDYDLICCA